MLTHTRALQFPTTIECDIDGSTCHGVYLGHGQSKIVYRLPDDRVLKLCHKRNQEPDLFAKGHSVGAYPNMYASNQCTVHITKITSRTQTVTHPTWYAWVGDYTIPLDSILTKFPAVADVVIVGAVRAMIRAHSVGHILSDNGFYNFGWLKGNVVIIDAGSRPYAAVKLKREFNRTVMVKFWSNLKLLVHPTTLEKHRQQWNGAGCDMSTALKAYDDAWIRTIADSEITHGSLGA